jgi:hypothetical protein
MKVFAITLMIFGFVSPAVAQYASQFDSPDLKSGKVHVSRIVLTPVTAFVSQLDWKSTFRTGQADGSRIPAIGKGPSPGGRRDT